MQQTQPQTLAGRASYMSKSRFHAIEEVVASVTGDEEATAKIMKSICEVMKYDPDQNTYNESRAKTMRDWRQRVRDETGKSFYEASGRKDKRQQAKSAAEEPIFSLMIEPPRPLGEGASS